MNKLKLNFDFVRDVINYISCPKVTFVVWLSGKLDRYVRKLDPQI